jgi:midasin
MGAQVLAWLGGAVGAELDTSALTGHLLRACLQHQELNRAAAATALAASQQPHQQKGAGKGAGKATAPRGRKAASAAASTAWMLSPATEEEEGVDGVAIGGACVEEITLQRGPVGQVAARLRALLGDYPEHPVLLQLAAICTRCLSLPVTAPLKTALTGLELLLARAQVWEETAAKFVSLHAELQLVASLATRWRQLELASWMTTLKQVLRRHAAGAQRSWFHLYGLLVLGQQGEEGGQEGMEGAEEEGAGLFGAGSKRSRDRGMSRDEGGEAPDAWELRYRHTASVIEAFVQTSTIGEFEARLQLLLSFRTHLSLRLAQERARGDASASQLTLDVMAALANTEGYYRQFAPSVRRAIEAGLAPHEKDLQGFVALAKWEDRGFYSLRASAEKAQRYLHR